MHHFSKQEELIMLSVFRLKEEACLMTVRKDLIDNAGKDWAFGSLYVALKRLKQNGIVDFISGDPAPHRGGKAIKYFRLSDIGFKALRELKEMHNVMWKEFSEYSVDER